MQNIGIMPAVGESPLRERTVAAAMAQQAQHSQRLDCSNCQHCNHPSNVRNWAGARISVNLRRFFSDERACVYMWAPYGRCVQWLRRRLVLEYGLHENIALMCRGRLLPVVEPLLILDANDPVEVMDMSGVFTPHCQNEDPGATMQKNTNKISEITTQLETKVQSNVSIIEENLVPSRGDNMGDPQNNLEGYPLEDMENTMGSLESQSVDNNEDLQRIKQRALRLLDEHCHVLQEGSEPKRLRRRRRRRRAPAAAAAAGPSSAASDDAEPRDWTASGGAAVLRNGCGSRPPRLVRALSPSSPMSLV